ncbi:AsmA family protein [Rubellicoccus peritrichatus]|uniref:AsmA family protein n=1 Tax=Rubellicoccus peritrichatus TaxID=3080537 RepID=A0AAQ3QV66_9BACT|nr:AsmA family protein [Puniceicoccus sp. CR14]WOO40590.1 AsmA family protein [Puniceicoccus sp. CR14]
MKKLLIGIGLVVVIAIAVCLIMLGSIASSVVKSAINTYGPQMTGTDVTVDSVSIQPYIGRGEISDLKVANPKGYSSPEAFTLESVSISLSPSSLLTDTIVINEITISKPVFAYERELLSSNISTLLDNIKTNTKKTDKAASEDAAADGDGTQKSFILKKVVVTGGVVNLGVLGQSSTVKLPEINLESVSPEGISAAEVTQKVLDIVLEKVMVAATKLAVNVATDPTGTAQGVTDAALGTASDVTKSVTGAVEGLFGGKKSDDEKKE